MNSVPKKPYFGDQPFLFVSYSHQDSDQVYKYIPELQERGYRIWYDQGIHPHESWADSIAEQIISSNFVLAFVTQNYVHSEYCTSELQYAHKNHKEALLIYLDDANLPLGLDMFSANVRGSF